MTKHDLYDTVLRDKKKYPVVAYGSAGTGKTYGAVTAAIEALESRKVGKVVVIRPNVSFANTAGLLPGTIREKLDPWVAPIIQYIGKSKAEAYEKRGLLEFHLLEHIQGLTFDNSFIILDECQNMTFDQLRVFLTRIGQYSKAVLCGDIAQISPRFKGSGLAELLKMVEEYELPVHTIEFGPEDIKRSELCKMFITAFEKWEAR